MDTALRNILLGHLQELQADFKDLNNEELVDCRESMLGRVNSCLIALGETDEDNLQ